MLVEELMSSRGSRASGVELLTNIVIGVGGKLTAGKDEFADYLVREHDFVKLGMSDVLADCLYALDPIIEVVGEEQDVWRYRRLVDRVGYVAAKKNLEVRRLLQYLGTEVGRNIISEDVWVKPAARKIERQLSAGRNVVITGIRYQNELDMVTYWDDRWSGSSGAGTTVWVDRPELNNSDSHSSESSLSAEDFEYVLSNTGTLEELYTRSGELLDAIKRDYL